jgi:hypothetical protein
LANLPVEQSVFGLFHLLRGALSSDFAQPSHAHHKFSKRYVDCTLERAIENIDIGGLLAALKEPKVALATPWDL